MTVEELIEKLSTYNRGCHVKIWNLHAHEIGNIVKVAYLTDGSDYIVIDTSFEA